MFNINVIKIVIVILIICFDIFIFNSSFFFSYLMLTWQPSQRTRGLLSGAHLRAKSAAAQASKIKKKSALRARPGVDPATCGKGRDDAYHHAT